MLVFEFKELYGALFDSMLVDSLPDTCNLCGNDLEISDSLREVKCEFCVAQGGFDTFKSNLQIHC